MRISVCIACHNEGPDLLATIGTALAGRDLPYEIVLVDDGSEKAQVELAEYLHRCEWTNFTFVPRSERMGSSTAKHLAVAKADFQSDAILVIDSHVRLPWDWVYQVRRALTTHPYTLFSTISTGIEPTSEHRGVGAVFEETSTWTKAVWNAEKTEGDYPPVPCVMGGAYFARKELWERVGGYAPACFGYGFEEEFLSMRAHAIGAKVRCAKTITVPHHYKEKVQRSPYPSMYTGVEEPLFNKIIAASVLSVERGDYFWAARTRLLDAASCETQRLFEGFSDCIEEARRDFNEFRVLSADQLRRVASLPEVS